MLVLVISLMVGISLVSDLEVIELWFGEFFIHFLLSNMI